MLYTYPYALGFPFHIYGIHMPLFSLYGYGIHIPLLLYKVVQPIVLGMALLWTLHCPKDRYCDVTMIWPFLFHGIRSDASETSANTLATRMHGDYRFFVGFNVICNTFRRNNPIYIEERNCSLSAVPVHARVAMPFFGKLLDIVSKLHHIIVLDYRNTAWLRDTFRQTSIGKSGAGADLRSALQPLTSLGTSAWPCRVTTQYSYYLPSFVQLREKILTSNVVVVKMYDCFIASCSIWLKACWLCLDYHNMIVFHLGCWWFYKHHKMLVAFNLSQVIYHDSSWKCHCWLLKTITLFPADFIYHEIIVDLLLQELTPTLHPPPNRTHPHPHPTQPPDV